MRHFFLDLDKMWSFPPNPSMYKLNQTCKSHSLASPGAAGLGCAFECFSKRFSARNRMQKCALLSCLGTDAPCVWVQSTPCRKHKCSTNIHSERVAKCDHPQRFGSQFDRLALKSIAINVDFSVPVSNVRGALE